MSAVNPLMRKGGIAIAALVAVSACATTKPTPQELAAVAAAEGQNLLPATREERDAADRQDMLTQATFWGREQEKNPADYEASLKLARALRAIGSAPRAAEVAAQALSFKPEDIELTLVYAQASLDQGQPEAAATALARAEAAGQGDWRMMSVIGVVMDALGQHTDAQDYYRKALALSPDNGRVWSNLGLSYALEGKTELSEQAMRTAVEKPDADLRVRQNLVLVLGLQGKFEDAEAATGRDIPPALAEANRAYFQALLTPARNWEALRTASN